MCIKSDKLNFKIIGEGYPVVFLHGFLESLTMWKYLDLTKFPFMSILIDLPGHGQSLNEDNKEPSIDYMSLKVQELLLDLNVTNFSIIGHSMGGYVSLSVKNDCLTQKKMNLNCQKVILLNSNFWLDSEEKRKDRLRVADIALKNKELFLQVAIPNLFINSSHYSSQISGLLEEALKMEGHSIAYASLAMRNRKSFEDLLRQRGADFLIIQGEKDSIVTADVMESVIRGLEVTYLKIKDVGHMAHIQTASVLEQAILDFI